MRVSAGPLLKIIVLRLIGVVDSFISSTINIRNHIYAKDLKHHDLMIHYNKCTQWNIDDTVQHDLDAPFTTLLLTDCQCDQWTNLCDDIDNVMEGLVSPAPESFCVLHSVVSKMNDDESQASEAIRGNSVNDLEALSSFLVKPSYGIELYLDHHMIKWRLITCNGRGNVIYPWECIEDVETELYQRHDTLQLSKMALEVATEYPNDCQTKQKIYDITCQAKVCEVCL